MPNSGGAKAVAIRIRGSSGSSFRELKSSESPRGIRCCPLGPSSPSVPPYQPQRLSDCSVTHPSPHTSSPRRFPRPAIPIASTMLASSKVLRGQAHAIAGAPPSHPRLGPGCVPPLCRAPSCQPRPAAAASSTALSPSAQSRELQQLPGGTSTPSMAQQRASSSSSSGCCSSSHSQPAAAAPAAAAILGLLARAAKMARLTRQALLSRCGGGGTLWWGG